MNNEDKKTIQTKKLGFDIKLAQIFTIFTLPIILLALRSSLKYILILSSIPFIIGIFFFLQLECITYYINHEKKKPDNMISRKW